MPSRIFWILIAGYCWLYVADSAITKAWASSMSGVAMVPQEPTGNEGGTSGMAVERQREDARRDASKAASSDRRKFEASPDMARERPKTTGKIALAPASRPAGHAGAQNTAASSKPSSAAGKGQAAATPSKPSSTAGTAGQASAAGHSQSSSATKSGAKKAGSAAGTADRSSNRQRLGTAAGTAGTTAHREDPGSEGGSKGHTGPKKKPQAKPPDDVVK